ncbi:uncharacterized protein LOC124164897 isoform X1 [Ischnura elegans]|uniref:uncharacterized protein LOC124164897 isoform X1 n=1 Tax=Ischnura elegans TaxID=197161 RepID=UPI001ED8B6FC|nr:uncharacterized protein LOC124164897 isoform X1 [Ischnura elegans]
MVVNAKVFLLVGILAVGINFFPLERGLTDAAPVKEPVITPAHHEAFEGIAEGIMEEARWVDEDDEADTANGAGNTDDETNQRGARSAGDAATDQRAPAPWGAAAISKPKRKGKGTQINVSN